MSIAALVIGSDIAQRLVTVENLLAGRLSTATYLLNDLEAMTSRAEVDSQSAMTSSLGVLRESMRILRNLSRVGDVTRTTRSRAHDFRVSSRRTHTGDIIIY